METKTLDWRNEFKMKKSSLTMIDPFLMASDPFSIEKAPLDTFSKSNTLWTEYDGTSNEKFPLIHWNFAQLKFHHIWFTLYICLWNDQFLIKNDLFVIEKDHFWWKIIQFWLKNPHYILKIAHFLLNWQVFAWKCPIVHWN